MPHLNGKAHVVLIGEFGAVWLRYRAEIDLRGLFQADFAVMRKESMSFRRRRIC